MVKYFANIKNDINFEEVFTKTPGVTGQRHNIMTTVEKIQKFLQEKTNIYSHIAGTGTLYIDYEGLKIRVADHEANYSLRAEADKSFYTKTADNQTFDVLDIIGEIFDYLEEKAGFDFSRELQMTLFNYEF